MVGPDLIWLNLCIQSKTAFSAVCGLSRSRDDRPVLPDHLIVGIGNKEIADRVDGHCLWITQALTDSRDLAR
jgi:hypothetical protein